jgi:AraC-like DNA-binding protein
MNVPIVYLCLFSIFLSLILLFYNKGYTRANLFLFAYLFSSSAFILSQYFLIYGKSIYLIGFFISGFPSFFFLIGPFAYFYVRSIFRDSIILLKIDYFHFLPFVIIFIGTIPFLVSPWSYKCFISQKILDGTFMSSNFNINFLVPKLINQMIRPFFALFYMILVCRDFVINRFHFKSYSRLKAIKIWLLLFFLLFFLTSFFYILAQTFAYTNTNFFSNKSFFYYSIITISFFYTCLVFSIILFPEILYGLLIPKLLFKNDPITSDTQSIQYSDDGTHTFNKNKITLDKLYFSIEYQLEIKSALHNWIEDKKYLKANTSLVSVSSYTNIPLHHLSFYFNSILKVKYPDWRNSLRIEHAKKKIDAGCIKFLTLEAISLESGFSSQSTFIRAFKNVHNCTPSEYIKSNN